MYERVFDVASKSAVGPRRRAGELSSINLSADTPPLSPGHLLTLQRLAGNAAVREIVQREVAAGPSQSTGGDGGGTAPPVTWAQSPHFPPPIELPGDEAARRVNEALDVMEGLTYVRRPPLEDLVASAEGPSDADVAVQTAPRVQRAGGSPPASFLAKVHGGVVGSVQLCWDCLTGEASLKGWIWAGVGYDAPVVGWVGGYWFGERTWWSGDLGRWFEPGQCAPGCDAQAGATSESGIGIAGFPLEIHPGERSRFSRGGLEGGFLLTPHSLCDGDLELIALVNVLGYLGPVGRIATSAVDGLNRLTRDSPHFVLEAGFDVSATFHLCRGANTLMTLNRADFCGGGFIGARVGLSHDKTGNHGVV